MFLLFMVMSIGVNGLKRIVLLHISIFKWSKKIGVSFYSGKIKALFWLVARALIIEMLYFPRRGIDTETSADIRKKK